MVLRASELHVDARGLLAASRPEMAHGLLQPIIHGVGAQVEQPSLVLAGYVVTSDEIQTLPLGGGELSKLVLWSQGLCHSTLRQALLSGRCAAAAKLLPGNLTPGTVKVAISKC